MTKKVNRARNWRNYNEALVQRGSITFWFSEDVIKNWHVNDSSSRRGRPRKYSDIAITCGLTLKAVFKLTFRAVEGFVRSLMKQLKISAETPDYSLLCKRQKTLAVKLPRKNLQAREGIHILVDTSGLKVFGEGEWKVRQHGYAKRRVWRKLHLAVNAKSHEIEAFQLTDLGIQDCEGFPLLINAIDKKIETVTGDGAYDRYAGYELAQEKEFKLIAPPRIDAKPTWECTSQKHGKKMIEMLKRRDAYIERIREIGLDNWKKEVGYHRRSLAETAMFRMKTLLGNKLKARTMANQETETAIRCLVLNKMVSLGFGVS
jgi:Transposase DDE domain